MSQKLVIKLTQGVEQPEALSQAFTVASTALASGIEVSFWLTGEASWLALPGKAEEFKLEHAASLTDLRDAIIAGGAMTLCTQCAARRNLSQADLIPGISIKGAASFVEEVTADHVQALIY